MVATPVRTLKLFLFVTHLVQLRSWTSASSSPSLPLSSPSSAPVRATSEGIVLPLRKNTAAAYLHQYASRLSISQTCVAWTGPTVYTLLNDVHLRDLGLELLEQLPDIARSFRIDELVRKNHVGKDLGQRRGVPVMAARGRRFHQVSFRGAAAVTTITPDEGSSKVRRCVVCGVTSTTLWRVGPEGKNTLCNACGIHWARTKKQDEPEKSPSSLAFDSKIPSPEQSSQPESKTPTLPSLHKMSIPALLN